MDLKRNSLHWHSLTTEESLQQLNVDLKTGLSDAEVQSRLSQFGLNQIPDEKGRNLFQMILAQISDFMIIILIIAAIVAEIMGETGDAVAILVIIIVNAVVGVIQEHKAEEALGALKKM